MPDLSTIIKAYDVRGVVPDQLDAAIARALGSAFARVSGAVGPDGVPASAVVVGYDMRPSSPELVAAFAAGVNAHGVDVIDIGLASTDQLYFASGTLGLPGAMFTASHNPAQYNGIKMCRAGAAPIGQETGLAEIRELAESELAESGLAESGLAESGLAAASPQVATARVPGTVEHRDLLVDYANYLLGLVDLDAMRPLKVVVDAGNGMGGHTVPGVFARIPVDLVPLYFELDGTFPNHEANPIEPENLRDLQAAVREHGADLGLAFDGDADRCFVVDEQGELVSPSELTALIAVRELALHPGSTVIHNLITSWTVPEVVRENGGVPERTRVGHSFIKARMAETDAVFGGEHSGHFYFREFWRADSGMLAALHLLAALGGTPAGTQLSTLLAPYRRYRASGEINTTVEDQTAVTVRVREAFAGREGVTLDELDGLTVAGADWWFNLRPSNTEPLLRLNAEARTQVTMVAVRDEVLALVRGTHA